MARGLLAAVRQAFGLANLVNNAISAAVTLALTVVISVVVRAFVHLSFPYLVPLAIAFFLLVFAGWLALVRRQPRSSPPQATFGSEGAPGELDVSIEREEWHPFRFKALILEARIRIHNRSAHTRRLRRHAVFPIYEPGHSPPGFEFMEDTEVSQEVHRLEESRNPWPRSVDPSETVYGWYVFSLPHRPQGGEPSYEIVVSDELGHEYGVKRLARPK